MPNLIQGRIVYLQVARPDPQGQNPKIGRKFIVVNTPESIANGDRLELVGISSQIGRSQQEVSLSWAHAGQRCRSGLTQPSVAVCDWCETAEQDEVDVSPHIIDPVQLRDILEITLDLNPGN